MKIKIIQYNILNGFCQDNSPYRINKERLKAASIILNKENADIIVLNEAFFWPFCIEENIKDYNKFFAQLYNIKAPTDRMFRWAPVIISRFPIKWKDKTSRELKFVEAEIEVNKKNVSLFAIHPPHEDYEDKKEFLIKKIFTERIPDLIIGDINALSPEDVYDEKKLLKGFKTFMYDKAEYKVKDFLTKKTINYILNKGFIDAFKKKNKQFEYTMPSNMMSNNKDSAIRIDYIFCSKNFKVVESGVIKNKYSEIASDHYPIYAVLKFK